MLDNNSHPFFIVGAQRSGTTMLRLMLNSHSRLSIPFESGFIPEFYYKKGLYGDISTSGPKAKFLKDIENDSFVKKGRLITDRHALLNTEIKDYADLVNAIFSIYAKSENKERWGDKTPSYITDIDVLKILFPKCKIIHLVRDGRDVALSLRKLDWGGENIPRLARDWRWKTTLGFKMGQLLGNDYLQVRYEDLVLSTEQELRKICGFLSEDYENDMLEYTSSAKSDMPPESIKYHQNSIRAPDKRKVYAWKEQMTVADRIIFEQEARDALELFGYEIEGRKSSLGSKFKNFYYANFKRW